MKQLGLVTGGDACLLACLHVSCLCVGVRVCTSPCVCFSREGMTAGAAPIERVMNQSVHVCDYNVRECKCLCRGCGGHRTHKVQS